MLRQHTLAYAFIHRGYTVNKQWHSLLNAEADEHSHAQRKQTVGKKQERERDRVRQNMSTYFEGVEAQ